MVTMRDLWHSFRKRVTARPRRSAIVALASATTAIVLIALIVGAASRPAYPVTAEPSQLSARWTLVELTSHIQAGDVTAVTVGVSQSGGRVLLARRADGQNAGVNLTTSVGDGAAALASLGYGDLLSAEARDAAADARGVAQATSDPLRTALNLLFLAVLIGFGITLFIRMRGNLPAIGRRGGRFATIMPAPERVASQMKATAAGIADAVGGSSGDVFLADVAGCEEAK